MKDRPKILQLAWEFPPLLTGGLGIACYGLSCALSEFADLTVIIPRSDPEFKITQFNLIGLNQIKLEDIKSEHDANDYSKFAEVREININLDPYASGITVSLEHLEPQERLEQLERLERLEQFTETKSSSINAFEAELLFADRDAYGPQIMRKVAAYTEVVCKLARSLDFDLIHAHDWITFAAAIRLKNETGKPLVLHIHSLETDRVSSNARNTVYDIELQGLQHADCVLPVSNFTRKNIIEQYGIDPNKIITVHNGVAPVIKFKSEKPENEKWVLFLGRVTRQKGPLMILETARKLARKMPHVKFYVAGAGDQLGYLKERVHLEGLSDFFVFTGFLSKKEVATLLSKTDAYFMPSISEPFGLSAVEAAQFDIPCVISKQSGVAELLHHALKADFWDTTKFSDLLYAVLNFEGINETIVGNTRFDLQQITWQHAALKIKDIYTGLIR